MKYSASELVKRSASQLLYKTLKKIDYKPTQRQLKGNQYADEIVFKNQASSEKRGVVELGNDLLFFCVDLVKDNKFVEIKMIEDENDWEDWYLYSSIMQSTFYASLLQLVKSLDTPKFRKKEGFSQEIINVPNNFQFELWFGKNHKYKIYPNEKILNHYLDKIEIVNEGIRTRNYDDCKRFDYKYKFKEFNIFRPKYIEIK